jgi:thiamine biosynthesis lipoprotein
LVAVEHIMGMPIVVETRDDGDGTEAAVARVFDWFRSVDGTFSTYRDDSEISRLNRGELTTDAVHADVREVLARCEELRGETNGYFDVRAAATGDGIDPSGLVKGWSVDRAATLLDEAGVEAFAINVAGDMRLRGGGWRVGIQHPLVRDAVARIVEAGDVAIATSGAYARGDHVLDPHTGRPPEGVLSVTVVGPCLGTADAYATAAFAMGRSGPAWTAHLRGYEAMTILSDNSVLTTARFPDAVAA